MCKRTQVFLFVLFVFVCCLVSGCGGNTSSSTNRLSEQSQTNSISSTNKVPERAQTGLSEPAQKEDVKKKDSTILNGKPVTEEMLQSFRDSVTEEEMKLFTKAAKQNRYTESQVRDFTAKMKMVGVDFSMLQEGRPLHDGVYFRIDNYKRENAAGDFCFLYDCSVRVTTQKEDKSKVSTIFICYRDKPGTMYTLYRDDIIVGDFSDMLISPEAKDNIISTINEYVSGRGGNPIDRVGIGYTYITAIKDAFTDESKWKGGEKENFPFIIPKSELRYTEPSEVYGEKEKERKSVFLFNKHGELLTVLHYPLPNEAQRKELIIQATEKVKL